MTKEPYMQGYKKIDQASIPEERGVASLYLHEKTGAQVLHLACPDPNKAFIIGFTTPPIGDTGNCHIMEHSVLCGSKKYPSKDPFMDMAKSSLATFINAMTYPDKTVYPVSSRNEKDFYNLMKVYLDAVFAPAVLENEKIFRQEGWRYEIFNPDDPIQIQGVVYNEMKGSRSSAENQISQANMAALFPATIYARQSGGDPDAIPQLSYEEFRNFHRDYYQASNAKIFLYGDMELEDCLDQITPYLDGFDKETIKKGTMDPADFQAPKEARSSYSLVEGEDPSKKAYFSCNWKIDQARTDFHAYLYKLLGELLVSSESSPLRKALLRDLGAEDVYYEILDVKNIGFSIIAKNVDPADKDLFKEIIARELRSMVDGGIEPDLLKGMVNKLEFQLREKSGSVNKGIVLGLSVMNEWNYGKNPLDRLAYSGKLKVLREKLDHGYMENYIQKNLIENPNRVLLVFDPQPGQAARKEEVQAKKLAQFKESLSPTDLDQLIQKNKDFRDWQSQEDRPEVQATIPSLKKDDLPKSSLNIDQDIKRFGQDIFLYHDLPTAGIDYFDIVFDASPISLAEIPYMTLALDLIGKLDTENYPVDELEKAEKLACGGIYTSPRLYQLKRSQDFKRKIMVSSKILDPQQIEKTLDLIEEELFKTQFDQAEKVLEEAKIKASSLQMDLVYMGSFYTSLRAQAKISPMAAYQEALQGLSYYLFLKDFIKNFNQDRLDKLMDTYQNLFSQPGRIVNLTTKQDRFQQMEGAIEEKLSQFTSKKRPAAPLDFQAQDSKEAFYTQSDVQFNAISGRLPDPWTFTGQQVVLSSCLSLDYLYQELRAKGGAYGMNAHFSPLGLINMSSYMDPHLARTYQVFEGAGKYVSQLDLSQEALTRRVVGAYGSFDQALTEKAKGRVGLSDYICEREPGYRDRILKEITECQLPDLHDLAPSMDQALAHASRVSLGSKSKILENQEYFDQIHEI